MKQNLTDTLALLERTPGTLNALLRDLPQDWTHASEGDNTWNAFEIVGHLIHGERADWIPRVTMILESGDKRTFVPFDREGHAREITGKRLPEMLDEFAALRAKNLDAIRALHLKDADLARPGRHPSLGPVTLSELLAAWAVHDLTHLHQISRVFAHQYRDAVGPWTRYMGVMQCGGHSASS
jgi:hypothetical protein